MDGKWMQRVCLHAVCLAEPDADSEAWDAISAAPSDKSGDAVVIRATRDLEAGEELLLDYGGRSNAELLTTHGFALPSNGHDAVPIELAPRDEQRDLKARLLAAGNLTSPFPLSPRALTTDSDLLVAMRIIAATPVELRRYADAFGGRPLSPRNEIKWRRLLRETVAALLADAEAETTAADDEALLGAAAAPAARAGRWPSGRRRRRGAPPPPPRRRRRRRRRHGGSAAATRRVPPRREAPPPAGPRRPRAGAARRAARRSCAAR